jgi:hypothetical protein
MSTRVDMLLEALEDTEVFFLEYSRVRSNNRSIFIIEGKDDPKFYTSKLASILGDRWDIVSVGGKSKVLEVRESIRNHPIYKGDSAFFLIDKDFDDRILKCDIYTTPCYSIENLYCEPATIKNLVIGECGLSNYKIPKRQEIIDYIVEEYKRIRSSFHKSRQAIAVNSIFLYTRKKLQDRKISLDQVVKIEVRIVEGQIRLKLTEKNKYRQMKQAERSKFHKFILNDAQLKEILANPGYLFRGKQEILLLKEFIKSLKDDGCTSNKVNQLFGHKIKLESQSLSENPLSSIAQYVHTPDCLIKFISSCKQPSALH